MQGIHSFTVTVGENLTKLSFSQKHTLKLREELNRESGFQTVWLVAQLSAILASPLH